MADTVVRQIKDATDIKEPHIQGKDTDVDGEVKVETPYTEYQAENGTPYLADRFELGDKADIFAAELSTIDEYISELVDTGKIANTTKAVEKVLREMEAFTNVTGEDRSVIRIETLAAHIDFLNKTNQARKDFGKYAN